MKKVFAGVMAGLLSLNLIACGSNSATVVASKSSDTAKKIESSEVVSETVEAEKKEEEKKVEEKKESVKVPEFDKKAVIEETVLIDQDDLKVTATQLTYTNSSADVTVTIENNSSKNLTFIANSLRFAGNSVNGVMVDSGYMYEDVAAGKKASEKVSFSLDELEAYGIYSIADLVIGVYTTDENYDSVFYEPVKITTDRADSYDYTVNTYQKNIEDGVLEALTESKVNYWNVEQIDVQGSTSIESIALITNKKGEQSFFVELKNDSEQNVSVEISNVAINGLVLYDSLWTQKVINAGTRGVIDIEVDNLVDKDYKSLVDVGEITSLDFRVELSDTDYNPITSSQSVKVNVKDQEVVYAESGTSITEVNGVKLTEIGLVKEEGSYSSYSYHILYVVENTGDTDVRAACEYDSLSVNGYMIDTFGDNTLTPAGMKSLLIIDMDEESLETAGITSIEDIKDIEFAFVIEDSDFSRIAEETVQYSK